MRGDQCKYDHGNDAVILADSVGGVPAYNPAAPSLDTSIPPPSALHTIPPPNIVDPYVPAASVIIDPNVPPPVATDQMPPLHLPPPGFPTGVHAPSTLGHKRGYENLDQGGSGYGPPAKRGFDFNRLGRGGRGGRGRGGFRGRGGGTTQVLSSLIFCFLQRAYIFPVIYKYYLLFQINSLPLEIYHLA